jgi:protein translocase SecG subunit
MLIGILLAAQIVVSLILIGVVLLQRSEGGGFVGGGSPSGMMSVRGAGDLLTRTPGSWVRPSSSSACCSRSWPAGRRARPPSSTG